VNAETSASSRAPARVEPPNVRTSARTNNTREEVNATTTAHDTPLLYTLPEAAALLRISRTKLYELLTANEIESVHIGRSRKIPATALHDYIDRLRTEEKR
jgi:excisionase family DNA binding protein